MQTPRVAVLGGTGFAGHTVLNELKAHSIEVETFSRTSGCDLLDLPTAWNRLSEYRPNYIVNCAALVGSVNFVTDFAADVVDTNMRIILNVYKIAQQLREAIVINPIANCAYPGFMDFYQESGFWSGEPHSSVLSYGSTRRMMWVLSKCYFNQYGIRSINLIVPNMYGPYDSVNPNKAHALNALVTKFVRAKKQQTKEVEVWGTGKPVREWLYVKDFAAVVRQIIQSGQFNLDPVNIGQNQGYSVNELVDTLKKITNFDGKITHNTAYPDGTLKKVMDDKVFRQRFPDFKFTPLETGLLETLEYYDEIL